jgi:hypothetical protein
MADRLHLIKQLFVHDLRDGVFLNVILRDIGPDISLVPEQSVKGRLIPG